MSSAGEMAKAASPESIRDDRLCVLKKVAELPLVSSTYEKVSATYTSAKESYPAIQAVCDMAEVGVKAIASTAASGAQPLLDKLEPQITAVDTLACKSLDVLQEKFPVVQQTVDKVVSDARDLLSLTPVYTRVTEAAQESIEKARCAVRNGVNVVMETRMGQMVYDSVGAMINRSDIWIDENLPITDSELAALAASAELEDPDDIPIPVMWKKQTHYMRLSSVSAKLRSRAYYHSLEKLQEIGRNVDMVLFYLEQFMYMMKFEKEKWEYKLKRGHEKVRQWIRGQPVPSQPSQEEMEAEALKLSESITQQMKANCLKFLAEIEGLPDAVKEKGLPDALKEKVKQAHSNMQELQAALSSAQTSQEVSSGLLNKSSEKIGKAQEVVHEAMEHVSKKPLLA